MYPNSLHRIRLEYMQQSWVMIAEVKTKNVERLKNDVGLDGRKERT
jgi:hypothetical protein